MWFFNNPKIIFGEDALTWLGQIKGSRAFIVTDQSMLDLGFVGKVQEQLAAAGLSWAVFAEVLPDPDADQVMRCAAAMLRFAPDWIIGLGGGSSLDAAKAAWFAYERPDVPLEAINPIEEFGLGRKARLITIPTTAGSGAEVTAAAVIINPQTGAKMELATFELVPYAAVIDPLFTLQMPAQLTADTGVDVLTHAVEGYSCAWANDFSDSLCLASAEMVFEYLPRAVRHGASDPEARHKMANAATIAAMGMGCSHIALAHALGHSAGARLHIPHGRITGLCLPYSIEFTALAEPGVGRYSGLARRLHLPCASEREAGFALAGKVRALMAELNQPLSMQEAGIGRDQFEENLDHLCLAAQEDSAIATARRVPDYGEFQRLYTCIFDGQVVDF